MKRAIKKGSHRLGLESIAERLYFNAKTASPTVPRREFGYRRGAAEDGYALPPNRLIFDVIACRWAAVYYDSGRLLSDDMASILARNQRPLSSFESILDFGCGCGRIIRHLPGRTDARLHGTDYNADLVDWCQKNLPFAQFEVNQLEPQLPFDDASFDYIYARSVLTHLPHDLQLRWMTELHRVLRTEGVLYFTMHGRPLAGGLTDAQRAQFEKDELVTTYSALAGKNICSTYATRRFVERELLDGFKFLDFVEGRDVEHLRQDIYLFEKANGENPRRAATS